MLWNARVADEYQRLMDLFGVKLGIAKSVISPKGLGLEFAKKTLYMGLDVSPAPLKEAQSSHFGTFRSVSLMKKYGLTPTKWLRFLGYGYKVDISKMSKKMSVLRTALTIPKDYKDFQALFSFEGGFLSPNSRIRVELEAHLILLLMHEATVLKSQISDLRHTLATFDAQLHLDTFPVWESRPDKSGLVEDR